MAKQEEESKRLGARMIGMLSKLQRNSTPRDMTLSGIELGPIRAKILITNLVYNTSLSCLSMNRKLVEDEVGVDLARMLMLNKHVRKLELEGNKLGPKTAKAFGDVLRHSKTMKFIDLDNNLLTSDGDDMTGLQYFIEGLKENKSLLTLNMANNRLDDQMGKCFVEALEVNKTLIDFEFGFNQFDVDTIRKI